jgi:type II secretory pathway pseudopilin PulG
VKARAMSNRGFTLIQVLVAMALAAGLLVFIVSTVNLGQKGAKSVENLTEIQSLEQMLIALTRNDTLCGRNLPPLSTPFNASMVTQNAGDALKAGVELPSLRTFDAAGNATGVLAAFNGASRGGLKNLRLHVYPKTAPAAGTGLATIAFVITGQKPGAVGAPNFQTEPVYATVATSTLPLGIAFYGTSCVNTQPTGLQYGKNFVSDRPSLGPSGVWNFDASGDYRWERTNLDPGQYAVTVSAQVMPQRCNACWNPSVYGASVNGVPTIQLPAGADDEFEFTSMKTFYSVDVASVPATGPQAGKLQIRFYKVIPGGNWNNRAKEMNNLAISAIRVGN